MNEKGLEKGTKLFHDIQSLKKDITGAEDFITTHKEGGIYYISHENRSYWIYQPEITLVDVKLIVLADIVKMELKLKELEKEFKELK